MYIPVVILFIKFSRILLFRLDIQMFIRILRLMKLLFLLAVLVIYQCFVKYQFQFYHWSRAPDHYFRDRRDRRDRSPFRDRTPFRDRRGRRVSIDLRFFLLAPPRSDLRSVVL